MSIPPESSSSSNHDYAGTLTRRIRIRRINHGARFADSSSSFISLASASTPSSRIHQTHDSDIELLSHVTVYLPGDWTFLPDTIIDPDSVRFFQKTRVFALQQFIRLLVARHRFWQVLENGPTSGEEVSAVIAEITQREYQWTRG